MKDRSSKNSRVELKKTVIHQHQIPGQNWGAVRSPYKSTEEGKAVETYREEKERRRRKKLAFLTGGGESTNPENMQALYVSVQ